MKDMNEGKGLTEADQVWIEENAQQQLLAESAEADATHQAEVQQLQSDIEKVPLNAHHVGALPGLCVTCCVPCLPTDQGEDGRARDYQDG